MARYHHSHAPLPAALDARREQQRLLHVRDSTGQALAYVYFEDEAGRRSAAKLPSKDEARRMAANFKGFTVSFALSSQCTT